MRGSLFTCTVLLLCACTCVRAVQRSQMFAFGPSAGDDLLDPGTDETLSLPLDRNLFYYDDEFDTVYINTNGFVGVAEPTPEAEYLGKLPSSFRMIAALLGDLDTSDGRGRVYYRQDSSPLVLQRAAQHISLAFPNDDGVDPVHAVIVTWENVAAAGGSSRGDGLDRKRNTFQLVIASMESASYAIMLYPADGLQYLSTTVGGDAKPLEAGFIQGLVKGWFGWNNPGEYYRTTEEEEDSIRQLTENTNSGRRGVWVYEIGTSPIFIEITPGKVEDPQDEGAGPRVTQRPRQTGGQQEGAFPAYDAETTTVDYEQEVDFTTEEPEYTDIETSPPRRYPPDTQPRYPDRPRYPEPERPRYPEPERPRYGVPERPRYSVPEPVRPVPPHSRPQNPQIVVVDEDLDVDVFAYNFETCAKNRHRCSSFADCRDYSTGYCCHCRPGFYGNGKDCVADGIPQRMNGKVNGRLFVGSSPSAVELNNNDLHSYAVPNDGRAYVAISSIPDPLGPSLLPLFSVGGVIGWAFALEQPGGQNGFSLIGGEFSRQAEVVFQPGGERVSIRQEFQGIDEHGHLVVSTHLEGRLPEVPQGATVQIEPYNEIYQYGTNLITSSSSRQFTISLSDGSVQTRSYQWRQTITYRGCSHDDGGDARPAPPAQQLSVDHIFVFHDVENSLIRFATSNKIGSIHSGIPEQNPCFTGTHGCDNNAVCRPGNGLQFRCECTTGFTGDGRACYDVDECVDTQVCGLNAVCNNQPGTFRCQCHHGYQFSTDGKTCVVDNRPVDHCARGSHTCDVPERALCSYTGASDYICSCLPGFLGDGRSCVDIDECQQGRCHRDAVCLNTQGSFSCQCRPGYQGDGLQCTEERREEKTACELHRDRVVQASSSSTGTFLSFFRPRPAVGQYVPQCDAHGAYQPTQCHHIVGQCWCVDARGEEIPDTRQTGGRPLCIDHGVAPPPVGPTPRPDISPVAAGTHLLFAQSGRIEHLPLDGNHMMKDKATPLLHVPDKVVIAVAYDCVDHMVYWTDITGPAISRAHLNGGDTVPVVTADLESPEGVAIDHLARLLFWTDSMRDTVEVARLDGSQRRVLFNTDLVNPRAIVADPTYGRLYWTDWNRDGPKIEMSNMDGSERTVLVKDDLALPNGLTYDPDSQQLCWADAGTHKVECVDPARRVRHQIVEGVQYPFSVVAYGRYLYYTDWRREAVVAVDRQTGRETDEFLPQKRSRVYGITTTPTQCHQAYNYCSNNGGCSHLCLPRPGGFTCRCPDSPIGRCVDANL